jgi:hypothetical protein
MDNSSLEKIVEAVVREVLRASQQAPPGPKAPEETPAPAASPSPPEPAGADVLALFTGSYHALDQVTNGLRAVAGAGYSAAAMLSTGAQNVLAGRATPEGLSVSRILPYKYPERFAPFFSRFRLVTLPTLTRTTAAKLAWGICDTLVTEAAYTALALNLPVIAVTDGMSGEEQCPECANFLPYVMQLNAEYLQRLEKLGIKLVRAEEFGDEVLRFLRGARTPGPMYRGLITLEDVLSVTGGEIVAAEGTLITALAQDHLHDHGVTIRYVPPTSGE